MAFSVFRRFFGGAVNTATGYAIGGAMQPALNPLTQDLANRTWALHPDRPVDPALLANAVAQGQLARTAAKDEAALSGISGDRFDQLVQVFDTGPGVSQAFELRRRGLITDAGFGRALKREGIEDEWIADMRGLLNVLLTPAELANAVVQGHRGFDAAAADAELQGVSQANFQTMVDNTGLPPGPATGLEWLRRGVLDTTEFGQLVREGHTKVKYIQKYLDALHPVLSHTTYAGLRLRGWLTKTESDTGGALTGYTPEQMELEFLNRGRPATSHQVHIGFQRGGRNAQIGDNERATFAKAIQESDIRPEWEPILWAQRYTYPPFFALRTLLTDKVLTEAEGEQVLLFEGWEPSFAKKVATHFAAQTKAAAVDPYIAKADNQLWTALHKAYVKTGAVRTDVEPILTRLVTNTADRNEIFSDWDAERKAQAFSAPPA